MTRLDFSGSGSLMRSPRIRGTTCHETPNLSVSQPHTFFSPPAESLSQYSSTSSCVSHVTSSEMPCEKENDGPPFSVTNGCPSSSNVAVITDPAGPGPASPVRDPRIIEDRGVELD